MKVVKTAAMVVGAVALVATGVGAVVGGAAFLATTGISLATVSAIGTVAGLVGTVASAISPPKAAKGSVGGSQTDFKLDPNAGIPYAIGRTYAGGNIAHRDTWGADNRYQGFAVTYSGAGTLQAFESFQVDYTPTGVAANGSVYGTFAGWLWAKMTLPATPAAPLVSPVAGFPGFGPSFRMSGHATNVIVVQFDVKDGKKFTAGIPKFGAVVLGERVYDPRQDSTYPGGNGPCRAGVEATYVGGAAAENPWLHGLTFALGRFQNGRRVLGVGQSLSSIDVTSFVEAANVADANGWKCGGVVYSIDDKWDVMRMLAQAGGGQCLRLGARLSCTVNAPRVALATVTDDDLVGKGVVSAAQTYRDRLNGMVPRFRSEANGWEMVPASTVRVAEYVLVDGEEKTREWPLPLVQQAVQAGQLTAYELVNRREIGPIDLPLFIRFLGYKPGDALNLNIGKMGLVNQLAIVRKRGVDPESGNVQLTFLSETTGKHAYALGQVSTAPAIASLAVPDESYVPAPQPADWSAVGGELENAGVKTPAIFLAGVSRMATAEAFFVEVRPAASAAWRSVGTYPAQTEKVDILEVAAEAAYYVGVSFVRRGVVGERLQLGPVVAGKSVASDFLYPDGTLGSELQPADPGATAGAPAGTTIGGVRQADGSYSGGRPVEQIIEEVDQLLAGGGGDDGGAAAAAAAASASAANAARDAAQQARDLAIQAKTDSQAARDAAQAARDTARDKALASAQSASDASGFATSASGFASTASTKADEAGQSATAAQGQVQLANTARSNAEQARDAAVAANSSASGFSASAAESNRLAAVARDAAIGAQGASGVSAQASADSARSAAASNTAAGISAGAAQQDRIAAGTARGLAEAARDVAVQSKSDADGYRSAAAASASLAAQTFEKSAQLYGNGDFDFGMSGWTSGSTRGNGPGIMQPNPNYDGRTNTVRCPQSEAITLFGPSVAISSGDQRFRLRSGWRSSGGVTPLVFYVGYLCYDAIGGALGHTDGTGNYPLSPGQSFASPAGWIDRTVVVGPGAPPASPYGGTTAFPAGAALFRPIIYMNYTEVAAPSDLDYFKVTDVTSELVAAQKAQASSDSASAASASQAAAGVSAQAASGYRDQASSFSDAASTSAQSAGGSAASASLNAAAAAQSQKISAAYATTRGVTPNAFFEQRDAGWIISPGLVWNPNWWIWGPGYRVTANYGTAGSAEHVRVDPSRKYRLNFKFVVHGNNSGSGQVYIGLECYDAAKNFLGNAYSPAALFNGTPTFPPGTVVDNSSVFSGQAGSAPYYGHTTKFVTGTVFVRLIALLNYPSPTPQDGSSDLNALWLEDATGEINASSSAQIASDQAVSATAASASASSSAVLSASLSGGALNRNAVFADYPALGDVPPGWGNWSNGGRSTRVWGTGDLSAGGNTVEGSPYAVSQVANAGEEVGLYSDFAGPAGAFVLNATVQLLDGVYARSGMLLQAFNSGGGYLGEAGIDFSVDKDTDGKTTAQLTTAFAPRRFSKLVFVPGGMSAKLIRVYLMTAWSGWSGGAAYKNMAWYRCAARAASTAEVATGQIPDLDARVSSAAAVAAAADGRTQAYWAVSAVAGGARAAIEARAMSNPDGSTASGVGIVAEEFSVTSTANGVRKRVLRVVGSDVLIDGNLSATAGVFLGSGQKWSYQLKTKTFAVSDGQVVSFGVDLGSVPGVDFSTVGLAPLAQGETYRLYPDQLSSTGFVARMRIVTPGASGAYSASNSTVPGSGPTRQLSLAGQPQSTSGSYQFTINGSYTGTPVLINDPYA